MKFYPLFIFFFISVTAVCLPVTALKAQGHLIHVERTNNTSIKVKPSPNKEFKKKKIRYIVKSDTKNLLLGNKCAEEETLKMGFMYVATPKGQPGNKDQVKRTFKNLATKTFLLFKNGPFWKYRLKKRVKKCRQMTGDFVG